MVYKEKMQRLISQLINFADNKLKRTPPKDKLWIIIEDNFSILDSSSCKIKLPNYDTIFKTKNIEEDILDIEKLFNERFPPTIEPLSNFKSVFNSEVRQLDERYNWYKEFMYFLQNEFYFTNYEANGLIFDILKTYTRCYYRVSRNDLLEEFTKIAMISIAYIIWRFPVSYMLSVLFMHEDKRGVKSNKTHKERLRLECKRRGADYSTLLSNARKLYGEIEPIKVKYIIYLSGLCPEEDLSIQIGQNFILRIPRIQDFLDSKILASKDYICDILNKLANSHIMSVVDISFNTKEPFYSSQGINFIIEAIERTFSLYKFGHIKYVGKKLIRPFELIFALGGSFPSDYFDINQEKSSNCYRLKAYEKQKFSNYVRMVLPFMLYLVQISERFESDTLSQGISLRPIHYALSLYKVTDLYYKTLDSSTMSERIENLVAAYEILYKLYIKFGMIQKSEKGFLVEMVNHFGTLLEKLGFPGLRDNDMKPPDILHKFRKARNSIVHPPKKVPEYFTYDIFLKSADYLRILINLHILPLIRFPRFAFILMNALATQRLDDYEDKIRNLIDLFDISEHYLKGFGDGWIEI